MSGGKEVAVRQPSVLGYLILAGLSSRPQRKLSLFGVLSGRQTASTIFSGFEQDNLRFYGVMPRLDRKQYESQVNALVSGGYVHSESTGISITPAGTALLAQNAAFMQQLAAFRPDLNVTAFMPVFYLAVQTVSEMCYANHQYRPAIADLRVQMRVRQWYAQCGRELGAVVSELSTLFEQLDDETADLLAGQLIGHEYSGNPNAATGALSVQLAGCALLQKVTAQRAPHWYALWGGKVSMLTQPMQQTLVEFNSGATLEQIVQRRRLRFSTVSEHIQVAAIFGANIDFTRFYSERVRQQLLACWRSGGQSYKELLSATPELDFLTVRMFQIEQLRGEKHAQ